MQQTIQQTKRKAYLMTPRQESRDAVHEIDVNKVHNIRERRRMIAHKRICMTMSSENGASNFLPSTPVCATSLPITENELLFPRQLSFDDENCEKEYKLRERFDQNVMLTNLMLPSLSPQKKSQKRRFLLPKVSKSTRNVSPDRTALPHILGSCSITESRLSYSQETSHSLNEVRSPEGIIIGGSVFNASSEERIRSLVNDLKNTVHRLEITSRVPPPEHLFIPEL